MIGNLTIDGSKQKINVRFCTLNDFGAYIEIKDDKCEDEDVIFDGQSIEYDIPVKRNSF